MKYYQVYFNFQIKEVEVEKETDKCIFIKGSRTFKKSEYCSYFKTIEEAEEFIVTELKRKIENENKKIEYSLKKIEELTELLNNYKPTTTHKEA